MLKKIAFFTNIAPHYRERLWSILAKEKEIDFNFFFGSSQSIKEINFASDPWLPYYHKTNQLKNRKYKKVLFWQSGVLKHVLKKWDLVIFLGDMYIISTWIATIILKLQGVPVVYWSHGIYGNESYLKKKLRIIFFKMADKHLLYGQNGRNQMIKAGFKENNLIIVYNSLDYDAHLQLRKKVVDINYYKKCNFFTNSELPILIFIGRLTSEKKIKSLIQAVIKINDETPKVNLMIVGDGAEKENLIIEANKSNQNIFFYGALYDEYKIGKLLANASLCVSPGNIGLSAIHSLSFGTPVCTHNNMKEQMPEAEAIEDGVTGIFFNKKDNNLCEKILEWINSKKSRERIREDCYKVVDEKYNPHRQLEIIKRVIEEIGHENSPN